VRAARDSWLNPALALSLCAAAGGTFAWLRVPLPWMIGPLIAMATSNIAGADLRAPRMARAAGQVVIGVALGLYFTPLVVRETLSFWPLLLLAAAVAIGLGVLSGWVLSAASGVDRTTAFFASVPGGATEMTLLGERFGARADRVALAQSLRIVVVVMVIPVALTYSGAHGSDTYVPIQIPFRAPGLGLLLAAATVCGLVLARLKLPNAFMFGPLALSIALTAGDVQLSSMPGPLSSAAQTLLGCALGARFERRSFERAPRFVFGVLVSVGAAIAVSSAVAIAVAASIGLPAASMVLAMAPGGIAEMCITAKVLQLGVPLVTATHVTRVFVLLASTGTVYRWARSRLERARRARQY
jgi:membrane AbrB-like protein